MEFWRGAAKKPISQGPKSGRAAQGPGPFDLRPNWRAIGKRKSLYGEKKGPRGGRGGQHLGGRRGKNRPPPGGWGGVPARRPGGRATAPRAARGKEKIEYLGKKKIGEKKRKKSPSAA